MEKWCFFSCKDHADARERIISVIHDVSVVSFVMRHILFSLLRHALQVQRRSVVSEAGTDSSVVIVAGTVGLDVSRCCIPHGDADIWTAGVDRYEQEIV